MPLLRSKSKEAFKSNIKAEMDAGKPQNQALAIAYSMKRKAQNKAKGGMIQNEKLHPHHEPKQMPLEDPLASEMEAMGPAEKAMHKLRMSRGGMVEPMEDDFLSDEMSNEEENDDLLSHEHYPSEPEEMSEVPAPQRRRMFRKL